MPMTVVNPPPIQEMSMSENRGPAALENGAGNAEREAEKSEHDDVEVIPL